MADLAEDWEEKQRITDQLFLTEDLISEIEMVSQSTREENERVPEKEVVRKNFGWIFAIIILILSATFGEIIVQNPFKPGIAADTRCVQYYSAIGPGENETATSFVYPSPRFYWRFWRYKTNEEIVRERMIRFDLY